MAEKEGEATGIWLIVVLVIVAAALLLKDEFRKPKPHAPAAAVTAQAPAAAPIAAASNPATTPDANDSIQPPDPRVVFESDDR